MQEIVNELYALIQNPPEVEDEWCDSLGHDIANMLRDRMKEQRAGGKLRLSMIGKPPRQVWYEINEPDKKEPLHPAARFKFLFGDILELVYIGLIELAGHEVTHKQEEVELEGIKGHIDCLVDGKLVDIKSASSMSFKKFQQGILHTDDKFGYYAQLAAYSEAMGVPAAGWFVWDKQLGHLCFAEAKPDFMPNARELVKRLKNIINGPEPERCFEPVPEGKSGNMKLCTQCSYCPFKFHCWRDANGGYGIRTFLYSKGPVYLVEVKKEPNVPEVMDVEEA